MEAIGAGIPNHTTLTEKQIAQGLVGWKRGFFTDSWKGDTEEDFLLSLGGRRCLGRKVKFRVSRGRPVAIDGWLGTIAPRG